MIGALVRSPRKKLEQNLFKNVLNGSMDHWPFFLCKFNTIDYGLNENDVIGINKKQNATQKPWRVS